MPYQPTYQRSPLSQSITRALLTGLLATSPLLIATAAQAQSASAEQGRSYTIPAGNLDQALNRFASEAGILLSVDSRLTAGKQSSGLNGSYSLDEALAVLLAGTGLYAVNSDGNYSLAAKQVSAETLQLDATRVGGQAYSSVSADDGYVAKRASAGTKTDTPIIETPYSVSVVTREQIEAQQPKTVAQALRYTPGINGGTGRPAVRH